MHTDPVTGPSEPPPEPSAATVPAGGPYRSMTYAPPWIGGATIGALFLSAAILITYTMLPLPGQRSLGDVNYLVAGLLFVGHILVSRLYRTRLARRAPADGWAGPESAPTGRPTTE